MGTLRLIDVSEHNANIDWEQARNHIDGAIIRCGYGTDIASQDDKYWKRNADECTRLGIPFGTYLYSYANTDSKSRSEAAHVLRLIKGYNLSYPVYLDLEEEISPDTRIHAVRGAKIFGEIIEASGYWCGIYANENWYKTVIGNRLDQYTKWVAKYSLQKPVISNTDIWQYTSCGSIPGLTGNNSRVDVNYCYRDFPNIINSEGKQSPISTPAYNNEKRELIRVGQEHANNFAGAGLVCDGIRGELTVSAAVKVLQTALNMDYHQDLSIDGIIGQKL